MKKLLTLLFIAAGLSSNAQQTAGIVTYEYAQDWVKIVSSLPYLSNDEKERYKTTWKNDVAEKSKMKLYFNADQSMYTYESETAQSEDGRWTWRNREYVIRRDFAKETKSDAIEMLGKTYVVEDSLQAPKWKILNQLKDIAGHVCMKAETEDPIKQQKVIAWFAQDIPVSAGPEQYFGLPGLILELDLNDGNVVVTATQVELKDTTKELAVSKKIKGKKITNAEYNKLITEHIRDSVKAQRYPYNALRY